MTAIDRSAAPALAQHAPDPFPRCCSVASPSTAATRISGSARPCRARPRHGGRAQREGRLPRGRRHRPEPTRPRLVGAAGLPPVRSRRARPTRPLPADLGDRGDAATDSVSARRTVVGAALSPYCPRISDLSVQAIYDACSKTKPGAHEPPLAAAHRIGSTVEYVGAIDQLLGYVGREVLIRVSPTTTRRGASARPRRLGDMSATQFAATSRVLRRRST